MASTGVRILIDGVEMQAGKGVEGVSIRPRWKLIAGVGGSPSSFTYVIKSKNKSFIPRSYAEIQVWDNPTGRQVFGGRVVDITEQVDGTITLWDCLAEGLSRPLKRETIELLTYSGLDIFEMLANPTATGVPVGDTPTEGQFNPAGLLYHPDLSDDIVVRDADGNVVGSRYKVDRANIDAVQPINFTNKWRNRSVSDIMSDILSGTGVGLVHWIDPDGTIHARDPLEIDIEEDFLFDSSVDSLENVRFSRRSGNLINRVRVTDAQNATYNIPNIHRATDENIIILPYLYTTGASADEDAVIKIELNTGTEAVPIWTNLVVERDATGSFTQADSQVLWNELNKTLQIRPPLQFKTIRNAVRVTGVTLTSEAIEMEDRDSINTYGRGDHIEPGGELIGADAAIKKCQEIINTSHLAQLPLVLETRSFKPIGKVGYVNIPEYVSIPEDGIFMVTGYEATTRNNRDPMNVLYTYTLGILTYNIELV